MDMLPKMRDYMMTIKAGDFLVAKITFTDLFKFY